MSRAIPVRNQLELERKELVLTLRYCEACKVAREHVERRGVLRCVECQKRADRA